MKIGFDEKRAQRGTVGNITAYLTRIKVAKTSKIEESNTRTTSKSTGYII